MSDPSTDRYQDKRIARLEQQMASVLQRLEDLERAASPDGVVDAATQRDEMQEVAARICQQVERERGGFDSDLIGA